MLGHVNSLLNEKLIMNCGDEEKGEWSTLASCEGFFYMQKNRTVNRRENHLGLRNKTKMIADSRCIKLRMIGRARFNKTLMAI